MSDQPSPPAHADAGAFSGWDRSRLITEIEILRAHLDQLAHGGDAWPDIELAGDVSTVSVPEEIRPLFAQAQGYVARYFESLVHNPDRATISIAGERYILLRAASMSVEFVELVTSLYQDRGQEAARDVADNLLFDLAHALGQADALSFQEKMGVTDPIARLSAGPVHFAFSGWAFVEIHPESSPSADEEFFLFYDHPFSFESHAWLSKGRRSSRPVCVMNAGYSSGWCEESFGLPLVAAEVECVATGDPHCRFVMAPPSRIEEHLRQRGHAARAGAAEASGATVSVPEFFQRRRLEDELREAKARLEERVAERTAELSAVTEQLQLLARAVDAAVEGIVTMDSSPDGQLTIRTVNQGFVAITGIAESDAVGEPIEVVGIAPSDAPRLQRAAERVVAGRSFELEVGAHRPDGTEYSLELHVMPGASDEEQPRHWIGLFRDVTSRRRRLAELRHRAMFDPLTDLPNRALFISRLEQESEIARHGGEPFAVMIIDLDRFKEVNDTFGHHAGDALLEQVGPRLKRCVRKSDLVARLGGDEFAVLLPGIQSVDNATAQARQVLKSFRAPFDVVAQELPIGASVGVVVCPDHGDEASSLLRRADAAMYNAKQAKSGFEVYDEADDDTAPERLTLVSELRTAIPGGELRLHYQPQCDPASGECRRVEALVRWQHPSRGLLAPVEFIPLIELGTLIEELTDWVLEAAVGRCAGWVAAGLDLAVSVNVAARCVRDRDFPDRVQAVLERNALDPGRLTVEVTEGGLLIDAAKALPVFERLRALGVRLSIDDFGTGYSSFAHLRTLPVDELKVDRAFVRDLVGDRQDAAIVKATIDLGHSIGREIVAEGVEDQATLDRLATWGCDQAQGFVLARPMPADDLVAWMSERSSNRG